MAEQAAIGIATVLVAGIGAFWLAWALRIPAILLLLIFGFIAGPVTGLVNTDVLLGPLLTPVVSFSVGLILFEGGLTLRFSELGEGARVMWRLVSIGALVTWVLATLGAVAFVGLPWEIALLLGAILVVTGPTVIGPILREIRPARRVSSILKWESIVIDPIGATLAVLVFEAVLSTGLQDAAAAVALGLAKTVLVGTLAGALGAAILILLISRYWVPDYLQNPIALMIIAGVFTFSNLFQRESGLLTVTVMGVIMANQNRASIKSILEFKENLRVLLISALFILLAARIRWEDISDLGWGAVVFLGFLIAVIRPACVWASTLSSNLSLPEKGFLASLAPRGIVAAAVSSVFALRLEEAGVPGAASLVGMTFVVIIGTVAFYGLAARPVARLLKVAQPNPQGILVVGGHPWARQIARTLKDAGLQVLLVDSNPSNVHLAEQDGVPAVHGSILSEKIMSELETRGIGRVLALTSNDEVNALADLHCAELCGRSQVYQLAPNPKTADALDPLPRHFQGRILLGKEFTFTRLNTMFQDGARILSMRYPEPGSLEEENFERIERTSIPLFLIESTGRLNVYTPDNQPRPRPGQILVVLSHDSLAPKRTSQF